MSLGGRRRGGGAVLGGVVVANGPLIILLMEQEGESSGQEPTFDIIHNARSSRASRSRKSSVHLLERDKPMPKFKKLRKMTLNPESIRYQDIRDIEERHHKGPASHRGEIKEEEFNIDDFLELGGPHYAHPEPDLPEPPALDNKGSVRFLELVDELMGLELSEGA